MLEKQKVDSELTRARTALAKLRCERDAIAISLRKGELLRKCDTKLQLGFLLTGLRQRLMSFAHALPPRLAGQSEHTIGQIIDQEVRSALRDIAVWPQKLADPNWSEQIDADLLPTEVNGANSKLEQAERAEAAKRERANAVRRKKYAQSKEA